MRKICLLALLALNAQMPQVLAQDDDAELGQRQPAPAEEAADSIVDEGEPIQPVIAQPPQAESNPPVAPRATLEEEKQEKPEVNEEPATNSGFSFIEGRRRPGATFGFAVSRFDDIGEYNHYTYLYGKERLSPSFYGGYYLWSYLLDIGLVGRVGYYHAEGHPLASRTGLELPLKRELTNEVKDENQKLGLTLIPTQLAAEVALAPFKKRWVVLRGWMGIEYLYVQETIEPDLPATASKSTAAVYTNSGWNQGLVTGLMASFSLTGLDARSDNSFRALGIDRYYISLFAENISTIRAKFGNFDRKTYGIAFSFEGLR